MVTVEDEIHAEAPPARVFAYLDDPHNHVEITPSLVAVGDVEPLDDGGKRATFTYGLAGVEVDGDLVQTVYEPPGRMAFDLHGPLDGEIEVRIEAADGGSRVTYAAEYAIPGRVAAAVAEPFVRRYNEREVATLLSNLRTRLETGGAP